MGRFDRVRYAVRVARALWGVYPRQCVCCGFRGKFLAMGMPPRFDAQCPDCGSLERHRLFNLASRELALFDEPRDVLHFAPEATVTAFVKPRAAHYVTADLSGRNVDRRENIEALTFDDDSFDVVICSHVLEHVNDAVALREIRRVLKKNGVLLAMVPIVEGWDVTYEAPDVVDPALRTIHFGQDDHVRYYGRDFRTRMRAAGFQLEEFVAGGAETVRYGLLRGERVFLGRVLVGALEA